MVPPARLTFFNCVTTMTPVPAIATMPLLQATDAKLPGEPVQIESTVSKLLPEVSRLALPFEAGVNWYQIELERPFVVLPTTHGGVGSAASVVAPELSLVSANEFAVMEMALAKLSLAGGGATTVNVGNVTVAVVSVVPPPGGGERTPREFVLPKLARKLAGMVAERC